MERSASWPARLLALGAGLPLLADVPGAFTRGDVLRGAVVPFLAAAATAFALLAPGRDGPRGGRFLLLLAPVGVALAGAIAAGGSGWAGLLREGAPWITLAAVGLGWARTRPADLDDARLVRVLLAAGALAALWVLVDAAVRWSPGVGPFGRTGIAGPVLAALIPPGLAFAVGGTRNARAGGVAALLLGLACLVTASRTGVLAGLVAVPVTGFLLLRGVWRRRLAYGLGIGVLLVGGALAGAAAGAVPLPGSDVTLQVRVGLWEASARLLEERPFTGHGLGSFPAEVLRVRDPEEAAISRGRRPRVAHNDLLHAGAEGGVPALALLLAWLVGVLGLGFRGLRDTTDPAARRVRVAFLGTFLALALASLGEDVLLDPAAGLLAALAAGVLVATERASPRGGRARPAVLGVLLLLALGIAGVKTRDLLADVHLRRYRDAIQGGTDPASAVTAAQVELVDGALAWREDLPEALYRLAVHRAEFRDLDSARATWRQALAADPGMTEARLDIERSYEMQGRLDEARAVLEEAERHDPTRLDVHMRLGHLALGREPVPGEPPGDDFDPIAAHRHYNAAERVGPDRFEIAVARARIARRRGELEQAARLLREADRRVAPAPDVPLPGELLLESFRLAEVETRTPDLAAAGILGLALTAEPRLVDDVRIEAERMLRIGEEREDEARKAARGTLEPPDYAAADRAFQAAALRFAGLLHAKQVDPDLLLEEARTDGEIGDWRSALARYRALLSWATLGTPDASERSRMLERLATLFSEAARAATRVDAPLARYLYARGHAAQGLLLLARGEWEAARDRLRRAAEEAPEDGTVRLALAEALLAGGEADAAAEAVVEALERAPQLAATVESRAALAPLRDRDDVKAALEPR